MQPVIDATVSTTDTVSPLVDAGVEHEMTVDVYHLTAKARA